MGPVANALFANLSSLAVLAGLVLAAVFLWIYRTEIRGLLNRLGTHPPLAAPQQLPSPQREAIGHAAPDVDLRPDSAEAGEEAARLAKILADKPLPAERKLELALIDLANHMLRLEFEMTHRGIWGSQLEALLALRKEGPQPLARFHEAFLERIKQSLPELPSDAKTDFETWAGFLTRRPHPYVVIEGGVARITRRGEEFVRYASAMSLPGARPF
jgi:hypothetical protein